MWLVVAGAAIFAAFPSWYATMFSTFYLALVIVLVALIVRGVSFEFHRKIDDPRWRSTWRWSLTIGSALIPLLLGTALGDLLHGLPINSDPQLHRQLLGAAGPLRAVHRRHADRALPVPGRCLPHAQDGRRAARPGGPALRPARLAGRSGHLRLADLEPRRPQRRVRPQPDRRAGADRGRGVPPGSPRPARRVGPSLPPRQPSGASSASIFFELFPRVMLSSTNSAYNLTVANSASPSYTLKVMTVVAVIFFPIVLAYQGWSLWVFRKRLGAPVSTGVVAPGPDDPPAAQGQRPISATGE